MARRRPCDATLPRPRVFTYSLPRHIAPVPTAWRMLRGLNTWLQASRYSEPDGDCADFFLVPSHPSRGDDAGVARMFGYIRGQWPYWNRTVERGLARHLLMLPCDHGAGDCAYSRPMVPYKWAHLSPPGRFSGAEQENGKPYRRPRPHEQPIADWGGLAWEQLNPASPSRAVIFLQFNGKADQLGHADGRCLVCFQPGLDVRLPTPEMHMCGPLCGLHHVPNPDGHGRVQLPVAVQRELLGRHVRPGVGLAERHTAPRSSAADAAASVERRSSSCLLWWAGADRGNNADRKMLLEQAAGQADLCVTNTLSGARGANSSALSGRCEAATTGCNAAGALATTVGMDMSHSLSRADYCYSPLGWDNGDSDRYLPAVLHGCVPVM